ncbi:MAG: cellulase family glycosylhydrolase, partial [Caldilineales bacterium]|nr:cellulase family glycosylhydrolase [Caldilineales bacterium]
MKRGTIFVTVFLGILSLVVVAGRATMPIGLAQSTGYTAQQGVIRDPQGHPIPLRGVNWFGFETEIHVVHGLWARNWRDMIIQMKNLGFNAVRLPFCPDTLRGSSVGGIDYSRNPDLVGKNSLQILDMVMAELDAQGFYILLDHHRPDCNAISELWYTPTYSEQQWINDLVFVAQRYAHLPRFFAIDLKNEPHGAATWGTGNMATDWDAAASRAGQAVLAANPNLLVFVEGIQENPVCSGTINHWWGGNLEPLACTAPNLPANKVVYSPHVYGPDVYNQPYFNVPDFPANLPAIWEQHFGRFAGTHTLVVGEFGGRYGHGGDPKDRVWQDALVDWLIVKNLRSAFYWSWNPNSGDTGGILQDDWNTVWSDKMALLYRLWDTTAPTPAPTATRTPTATPIGGPVCSIAYRVDNDWGSGFVATVQVTNRSAAAWDGWTVTWTFGGNQQIVNLWNGRVTQTGPSVQVTHADWNQQVPPNGTVEFGFQAGYTGVNTVPNDLRVNGVDCGAGNGTP